MLVIISAYQVATTYMKVGLHPECGMKINARLLRPAPVLNKSGMQVVVQCSYRPARKVSQASLSIFKSRGARPSKVSQSQHRRQLHPTRPLQGRPSGRVRTNHLRGLPFPSLGQGDLASRVRWFAVAGAVVELLDSLPLINPNRIVPARLIPKPRVLPTRQQHPQHHIRLTVSVHSTAALTEKNAAAGELGRNMEPFPRTNTQHPSPARLALPSFTR